MEESIQPALFTPHGHAELDLAYMAGIIDGEGCICITISANNTLFSEVTVGNTNHVLLDWIHERWPGKIVERKQTWQQRKPFWTWRLFGARAADMLREIRPYLVIKQEQANLFIEMFDNVGMGKRTPPEFRERRLEICALLKALNQRGPSSAGQEISAIDQE